MDTNQLKFQIDKAHQGTSKGTILLVHGTAPQNIDGKVVSCSEYEKEFKILESNWTNLSKYYGFHLTIGDAIDFDVSKINDTKDKLSNIVKCFRASDNFTFTQCNEIIPDWSNLIVLRYNPCNNLKYLHSLVTTAN